VLELASGQLAGEALLWGIDQHNRFAHLGISLLPDFRGRGLAADTIRLLCHYGFQTRGLHRLQLETLADNEPMIHTALAIGFSREATIREGAWVTGQFLDEAIFGLLADEWRNG
jgi:RimJ/RimL family protein N-acetyltransferase